MKKMNLTQSDQLRTLITVVNTKVELLMLIKTEVEHNRDALLMGARRREAQREIIKAEVEHDRELLVLHARRLDMQHELLQKTLRDMQELLEQMQALVDQPPEQLAS